MRITDATVLVAGATGGIGAATAYLLHELGARVVLHGRDLERLAELAGRLGAETIVGDLAEPDGPAEVARKAGPVDVLVHCVGVGSRGQFAEAAAIDVERLVTVNLRAPMLLARELLPAMCAVGRGHLAFVGSIAGLTGVSQEAVYSGTKAGLLTFAQSLRFEVAHSGVTVSTISPAVVDTPFWQHRGVPYHRRSPRPISAEAVAALIVRDIEHGGGDRVVPRWLSLAPAVRGVSPRLYRGLAGRLDRA